MSDYDVEDAMEEFEDAECYYGAEFCIDPLCRDVESCLGCDVILPPKEGGDAHENKTKSV